MTTNTTFAKKLQAAIKAKIHELSVEADDELAEYAMILAANKKDKAQIKKELHLFLGKNTGCFVDWLFAAFERIQKTLAERKHPEKSSKSEASKKPAISAEGVSIGKQQPKDQKSAKETKAIKDSKSQENVSKSKSASKTVSRSEKKKDPSPPATKEHHTIWDTSSKQESKKETSPKQSRNKRPTSSKHERSPKREKIKESSSSRSEQSKEDSKKRKHEQVHHNEVVQISDGKTDDSLKARSGKRAKKNHSPDRHLKRPKIQAPSPKHSYSQKRHFDRPPSSSNHKERNRTHSTSSDHHKHQLEQTKKLASSLQEIEERNDGRSNDSTPAALTNVWDGRITIDEESSDDDAEAQIDALLDGLDELIDTIPETSILSGPNLSAHLIQAPSPVQTTSHTPPTTSAVSSTEVVAPKKLAEKCRFWPGCDKNEQCAFHHPTEVCAVFPNCPFGDRCLNIHPLCKFNKKCRKPRCPFTHDLKGVATVVLYPHDVAAAQQASTVAPPTVSKPVAPSNNSAACRFKGRCAVPNCKFMHPPPCRFGLRCQNPSCTFSHRKPDFTKFQWVNNSQQ